MTQTQKKKTMIPLSVPEIRGNEWQYIKECLDTNWVSSAGKYVTEFESVLADRAGCKHGVACVNGTSALHMALLIAGVKPDEEVLLPAITFVAPANAARYLGAWPVFIDVQPDTWQMDPEKVKDFVTQECAYTQGQLVNRHTKRRISAILPVHLLGHPVDMDPILEIAQKYNLKVIEDAAESIGAKYKDRPAGGLGDAGCFSFNGNKIITAGGGGMIVTNQQDWAEHARYLTTQAKDDPVECVHEEIGYNYRLTNIQAAMGVAQMEQLDQYMEKKCQIFRDYQKGLQNINGLTLQATASWAQPTYWLSTILVDEKAYGLSSRELLKKLSEENIETRPLWHPLHRLKPFKDCYAHNIEIADRLYRDALSLPSSIGLSAEDQKRVINAISEFSRS